MLIGYMRVSSENDRQVLDLQYDALIKDPNSALVLYTTSHL